METKSCNLTKEEVQTLMSIHGGNLIDYTTSPPQIKDEAVERIKYLNTRLKAFEDKGTQVTTETEAKSLAPETAPAQSQGWGNQNG